MKSQEYAHKPQRNCTFMNSGSVGTTAAGHLKIDKCGIPDSRSVADCPVEIDSVAAVQVPSERTAIHIRVCRRQ